MSPKIAVVGSLNMDIFVSLDRFPRIGETIHSNSLHYAPGGKGANQAVGCAKLENLVSMIGVVGDDIFGNQLREQLVAHNIDICSIEQHKGQNTGMAEIFLVDHNNSIIVNSGANSRCTPEVLAKYEHVIANADIMLTQLEIPIETIQFACSVAKKHGVKTVLNPAPATHLQEDLLKMVDFIKPNETEFELIFGSELLDSDEKIENKIKEWENRFNTKVIVTRGEKGASFVDDNIFLTIPPLEVSVVDTTGAGDAFNAAFVHAIANGLSIYKSVSFAVAASSLSITKFGAQSGLPTLEELSKVKKNKGDLQ